MPDPDSAAPLRLVISDPLAVEGLAILRSSALFDLVTVNGADRPALTRALATAAALLVRSGTAVDAELLERAPRLRLVGRAGTGIDNVDVEAATRRGVLVMNTPDANSIAAAEQTMALLLALVRRIVPAAGSLAAGRWDRGRFVGTELAGKTLGVIGFGRIGREVARRARAFDMPVLVHDPFVTDEVARAAEARLVRLDELLAAADVVTLHAPLTRATRHLIGAPQLARMKPTARLVNCARGGLVDEAALLAALEEKRLAGAALDVFESEPPAGSPLIGRPDVVATPHLGASTLEAQENVAVELARQVVDYFRSGAIRNAVNMPALSAESYQQAQPHLDLAERLGRLAGELRPGPWRRLRIEYLGEAAGLPLPALTLAALKGLLGTQAREAVNYVNARLKAAELGLVVEESFDPRSEDLATRVRLRLEGEGGGIDVAGTLARRRPRLVAVDDYELDAILAGTLLVLENDDVPGVVGEIGSLLGSAGVNIARINWGRNREGGSALTVIQVDQPPPGELLARMESGPHVSRVRLVELPAVP